MKKWLPLLLLLPMALWVLGGLAPRRDKDGVFAYQAFGRLPVLTNGRIQPIDSLARNSLLQLLEKQTVDTAPWIQLSVWDRITRKKYAEKEKLAATQWALEMFTNPAVADTRPVFRIDHPQLKSLLELLAEASTEKKSDGKTFAWSQIRPKLETIQNESQRVGAIKDELRSTYDKSVSKLWNGIVIYMRLQNTLQPQNAKAWGQELETYYKNVQPGVAAARAQQAKQSYDQAAFDRLMDDLQRFDTMMQLEPPMLIPPAKPGENPRAFLRVGQVLMDVARGEPTPYAVGAYARMSDAFRAGNVPAFNEAVADYTRSLGTTYSVELKKTRSEQFFNAFAPFMKAMAIYLFAGICVLVYWVNPARFEGVRKGAFYLMLLALVIHTAGLGFRMALEGRPPVTNLYSSAIFIGFGACLLGVILELFWKNAIGIMVASAIGFATLIIAHNLAMSGDTMEMMRAVLDSNFWLATHVVVVTLGYSATFVAGFLAIIYVLRGVFTPGLTADTGKSLSKMVYGIVCFATLFSFVGTVLGGIWADQSWGRFWGWDPKENGALIIVLWNALVLHARWGGMVRERGLMNLVIGGNIVTAWSWFGVNQLSIGLHSYGFTDSAMVTLIAFVISQVVLIAIGLLPTTVWRSRQALAAA